MISRQKLIEAITAGDYTTGNIFKDMELQQFIKDQPPADQWIPCSSGKLPLLCEPVLVTDALECVFKACLLADGNWETEYFILEGNYITAWMPLPEPYKEG